MKNVAFEYIFFGAQRRPINALFIFNSAAFVRGKETRIKLLYSHILMTLIITLIVLFHTLVIIQIPKINKNV